MAQRLINSIVQIFVFSVIPFVWWFITARNDSHFFDWIGLKKVKGGSRTFFWISGVSLAFLLASLFILYLLKDVEKATSEFSGQGLAVLPAILIYAILGTSLPEEILFRGFILKRFSYSFGFFKANMIQALLFGALHGLLFVSSAGLLRAIVVTLFTGGIAWIMGWINENKAGGSILPSWIIHSFANLATGILSAFLLF